MRKTASIFVAMGIFAGSAAFAGAPLCDGLVGKSFVGTERGEPADGCEGCGNPGSVEFMADGSAWYLLPGDDVVQSCTYKFGGDVVDVKCDTYSKTDYRFQVSGDCAELTDEAGRTYRLFDHGSN